MILTFTVRVEVPDVLGEKYVPYLKHLLAKRANLVGHCSVVYESWLTNAEDKAEEMEYTAWTQGEMEL